MFTRVHEDVEHNLGRDSMLLPLSAQDSELAAKREIESFQVATAARQLGKTGTSRANSPGTSVGSATFVWAKRLMTQHIAVVFAIT